MVVFFFRNFIASEKTLKAGGFFASFKTHIGFGIWKTIKEKSVISISTLRFTYLHIA